MVAPFGAAPVQLTLTWPAPGVVLIAVGAPGRPAGVTGAAAAAQPLSPTLLIAATRKKYCWPLVSPVIVADAAMLLADADHADQAVPLVEYCTSYPEIAAPPVPLPVGAVQLSTALRSPRVAETPVGASGARAGVTLAAGADSGPVLTLLVAATRKKYPVPFVRELTMALVWVEVIGADQDVPFVDHCTL